VYQIWTEEGRSGGRHNMIELRMRWAGHLVRNEARENFGADIWWDRERRNQSAIV